MKKMMILLPVLLVAGWMQAPQADVEGADESAIKAVLHKQTHSFFQRSYEGEADVWAQQPYIVKMSSNASLTVGWDSVGAGYKTLMEENPEPIEDLEVTHSDHHIQIHGDAAWVVYEQDMKGKFEGEAISSNNREVRFLARIDGKWKIVYQFTTALAPAEAE